MKYSLYNSAIAVGDHTIIYNSLSCKFILVKNKLINLKKGGEEYAQNDILQLTKSQLADAGFIIQKNSDEITLLKSLIESNDNNNNELIIHINPTLDCNFRCWYCYEKHIIGSKMSSEIRNGIINYIIKHIKSHPELKNISLSFFGGEPFLYFKDTVLPILNSIKELCMENNIGLNCHFTTNGSLLDIDTLEILEDFSPGFQITLDGGEYYHNKIRFYKGGYGSFHNILKNITSIVRKEMTIVLRINFTHENIKTIKDILPHLEQIEYPFRKFLRIDLQRVWQDRRTGKDYTEDMASEIRNAFRHAGFQVLSNYIPSNVRNSCYGDKYNHVLFNYDGNVYGCTARDFTIANRIGKLSEEGEIQYDDNKIQLWKNSKFSKPICHTCRIAPICGGGCRQRAIEASESETCIFGYSEKDKDDIILDIFDYTFCNQDSL